MKAEEIRAQISSLNDELKDTVKEVNAYHSERDLLLKEIEKLKTDKGKEQESLQKVRDNIQSVQLFHEQQVGLLNKQREEKQKELSDVIQRVDELKVKEAGLKDKIKGLKDDKKKLSAIHKELEEAEKNRPLIEAVKKELLEAIDNLNEAKFNLDKTNREAERVKEQSKKERSEHLVWLEETKAKTKSEVEGSVQLRIVWETKLKDLKVVEKRLKKLWEQTSKLPFPKTYDAREFTRN